VKYLRFGIYILIIFLLVLPFLVLPRVVKIKKIECYSQYGLCSNEFLAKIDPVLGMSVDEAKKKISEELKNIKLIEDYSFRFKLPSILRVDLIFNKAKYALYSKNSSKVAVIDAKGTILDKVQITNLPRVITDDDLPAVGETVESKKVFALELLYSIYYLYQIKEAEIVNDSLEIKMYDVGKIIFPLEGERDILLGSMKIILSRLNADTNSPKIGKVKEVDLRYKNPVVRYE